MERFVDVSDHDRLWAEATGDRESSALLLVMGANASGVAWPDELVDALAERHHVIRYDHRDTGRSTWAYDQHPYAIRDLAPDALAVMDAFGVDRAHVVGMSMGGILVQLLLLDAPERLLSATPFCTTALGSGLATDEGADADLPGPDPRLLAIWAEMGVPRPLEEELDWRVEHWRILNGDEIPFDPELFRAGEQRIIDHAGRDDSPSAHARADQSGLERGAELAEVEVPTLVIEAPATRSTRPLTPPTWRGPSEAPPWSPSPGWATPCRRRSFPCWSRRSWPTRAPSTLRPADGLVGRKPCRSALHPGLGAAGWRRRRAPRRGRRHRPQPQGGQPSMTSDTNSTGEITVSEGTETAILAGGCFWGMEDLFRRQPGVLSTRVGYTGGENANPTYRNHPGHAEAIEVVFDPSETTYRDILAFFFQIHDPSTLDRQGNDIGTSYRSAIFPLTAEQEQVARDTIADVDASGLWPAKAVTTIEPQGPFWEAEPEHQDYLERIPNGYTCHFPRPGWVLPERAEPGTRA